MLVTERFVFLHVPKTGGTFTAEAIRKHLEVHADTHYAHTPYSELEDRWRSLPGCYAVRNPWDWYVSWFHYELEEAPRRKPRRWDAGKRAVWHGAMRSGRAGFKEAVARACTGGFEHPLDAAIRAEGIDLYTATLRAIVGPALDRPDFTALRFERLNTELVRFLGRVGALTPPLEDAIRHGERRRTSRHGPYHEYYDDELAGLVGERAGWLCERFGYSF